MTRLSQPAAALALMISALTAHAAQPLGRLFFSPTERGEMDAKRSVPAQGGMAPSQGGMAASPGQAQGGPNMDWLTGGAGMTPGAQPPPGPPQPPMPAMPNAGAPAQAQSATAAAASPQRDTLQFNGVVRNSGGRSTVWLNGAPQASGQGNVRLPKGAGSTAIVTLPSGQQVKLKAGQRYDAEQQQVKDINEP